MEDRDYLRFLKGEYRRLNEQEIEITKRKAEVHKQISDMLDKMKKNGSKKIFGLNKKENELK